jgi:SpoVK/Ycf46/Vps4 family AAA+-type ATPase
VFSGLFGGPEDSFNKALKLCDSLAPMLLWIDEIEMGIGGYKAGTSGPTARIFATFLTWMQEHESMVFVAATANRVDLLPAEILRKGRFDQVFFVDLPTAEERIEIFKIHLSTRHCDLKKFNYATLAKLTKGWNGAEIEQAVITAIVEAQNEKREIESGDLLSAIGKTVPLSTTMVEQVQHIRKWAYKRALRASPKRE